jgi:hypothetical protein
MRGLLKVNIAGVMVVAGQNLKRFIKYRSNELFYLFQDRRLAFRAHYKPTSSTHIYNHDISRFDRTFPIRSKASLIFSKELAYTIRRYPSP